MAGFAKLLASLTRRWLWLLLVFFTMGHGFSHVVHDTYDYENQLVQRQATLNSQLIATHDLTYNGDGQRMSKTVNGARTDYVVDELSPTGYPQVLEEMENGSLSRVYAYGHSPIAQQQWTGANWQTSFYGHDGHGSIRHLTDGSGNVTDTYAYDAFGHLIDNQGSTPNTRLFTGEEFDLDLGLYYLRARYHNPDTGRFWTQDSFPGFQEDPASLHKYTYAHNDPVNNVDPSGHFTLVESMQVSGLVPTVRDSFLKLWSGVNNYTHGLAGGDAIKGNINNQAEALLIDTLSAQAGGWTGMGQTAFWSSAKGAPFLLQYNPYVTGPTIKNGQLVYDTVSFDVDALGNIYGPQAQCPLFELRYDSEQYQILEALGHTTVGIFKGAALSVGVGALLGAAPALIPGAITYGSIETTRFLAEQTLLGYDTTTGHQFTPQELKNRTGEFIGMGIGGWLTGKAGHSLGRMLRVIGERGLKFARGLFGESAGTRAAAQAAESKVFSRAGQALEQAKAAVEVPTPKPAPGSNLPPEPPTVQPTAAKATPKINNLADDVLDWVGPKSTLQKPPGGSDLILRSADGTKQIRFDLTNPHGLQPHVNVETFKPRNLFPGDRKMIQTGNEHVFPKP